MATKGIDVRQTTGQLVFRVSLKDANGAKVTTGTTELRVYRVEDDGTLDVYDWTTNVFVAPGSGTPDDETTMTHRQRRDSSDADVDTGVWTAVLSTLTNWAAGQVYLIQITNTAAAPESQEREFQFGLTQGDDAVGSVTTKTGYALANTGADLILKSSTFAFAIADAIWDEVLTAATHNVPTSAGRRLRQAEDTTVLETGEAQAGGNNTITLQAGSSSDDGNYLYTLVVLIGGTGAGQARHVESYDGANLIITVDRAWVINPDATTEYAIYPWSRTHVHVIGDGVITADVVAASAVEKIQATLAKTGADSDTLETLSDQMDGITGALGGEGAYTGTLTVDDGSTGLEGVVVNARRGGVLKASGTTDASGEITNWVFGAYTYDLAARLAGYQPKTDTITVSADAWTKTISLTAISITAPEAATLCTVQFRVQISGAAVSGAVCKARLLGINQASDGVILSNAELSDTTDAEGIAELQLVQEPSVIKGNGIYRIWVEIAGRPVASVECQIPNQSTILFEDLL